MTKRLLVATIAVVLLISPLFSAARVHAPWPVSAPADTNVGAPAAVKARIDSLLAEFPLYFVANQGQAAEAVSFYVQGRDNTVYFTPQGVTFALGATLAAADVSPPDASAGFGVASLIQYSSHTLARPAAQRWAVKLDFVGANPNVRPLGEARTAAVISYFKGQPHQWQTGVPTYAQVRYPNLWPGIDLVYSGRAGALKYEFVVQPGADPSRIQLAYRGASEVRLTADGQLDISTPVGGFRDAAPLAYQERDGQRLPVAMAYALTRVEAGGEQPYYRYGFALGEYDAALPLVLDPEILIYAGYIGGAEHDVAYGVAVDASGNAYVTGSTFSGEATFPVSAGPDLTYKGHGDAFITKVNAAGTALVYAGYIGGTGNDIGRSVVVDAGGNAYISGDTLSTQDSFPVLGGPDLTHNGGSDAFVAKVNAAGTALVYAGYIGGSGSDYGYSIAVDASGSAYVTGGTNSGEATFPVSGGPDLTYNGGNYYFGDAFIAKVNASGTALVYAGYIGGSAYDIGQSVAVDAGGNAYIAGVTESTEGSFPVLGGPDLTFNGEGDAFVAKVNASGTALVYAGYIGGSHYDSGYSVAVDAGGNAYVTGFTRSTQATFPVAVGPDLSHNGDADVFAAKVNAAGTALVYAGFIGGSGDDRGTSIAVDAAGNAYIVGETSSSHYSFPVRGGPDLTYNGNLDAFIAMVNPSGSALVYAGYIGGNKGDRANSVAVAADGGAYVVGETASLGSNFPVLVGPDLTFNGELDAFIAKVGPASTGLVDLAVSRVEIIQGVTMSDPYTVHIAGRPALMRVFVLVQGVASQTGVTGQLTRYVGGAAQDSIVSGPITATHKPEEDSLLATLSFQLPETWLVPDTEYVLQLDAHNAIVESDENNNRFPAAGTQRFNFVTAPVLDIVIVPVTYARPGAAVTNPALDDLTYLTWMLGEVYPTAQVNYSVRSTPLTFTGDLRAGAWGALLSAIHVIHETEDPAQSKIYYGLVDFYSVDGCGFCTGGIAYLNDPTRVIKKTAVGWTGYSHRPDDAGRTFAHEIGHVYGREHSQSDVNFPYERVAIDYYNLPSIGQWGYRASTNSLLSPDTHVDYMSQTSGFWPAWTSDYTYYSLYQAYRWLDGWPIDLPYKVFLPGLTRAISTAALDAADPSPSIVLSGIIAPDGSLTLEPIFSGQGSYIPTTMASPYQAVLIDGTGAALASQPLALTQIAFETAGDDYIGFGFSQQLPRMQAMAGVQIFKDGQLVYERRGAGVALSLDSLASFPGAGGELQLAWAASGPAAAGAASRAYRVLFSPDGGVSWHVLAVNTPDPSATVPAALLKDAVHPVLRVLASDGLQTAERWYDLRSAHP